MIRPDASNEELIIGSILLGYGSGIMHPLFSIAAQNAFSVKEIGVITSSLQFSRNMGATIITPLLGVIMYSALNTTKGSLDLSTIPARELSHAISLVFDGCIIIVLIGFLITFCLKDIKIANRSAPEREKGVEVREVHGA